jgi:hypothetical protein
MMTTAKRRTRIVVVSGKKAAPPSVFVSHTARDAEGVRNAVRAALQGVARAGSRLVTWVVSDLRLGDRLVEEKPEKVQDPLQRSIKGPDTLWSPFWSPSLWES